MKKIDTLGVLFILGGIAIFVVYGFYRFLEAENIPWFIRIGTAAVVIGVLIVLLSLIRERIMETKGLKKEKKSRPGKSGSGNRGNKK